MIKGQKKVRKADEDLPLFRSVAQERFEYVVAQLERESGKNASRVPIASMSFEAGQLTTSDERRRYNISIGNEVVAMFDEDTGQYWLQGKYAVAH